MLKKNELLKRIGNLSQLGYARPTILTDGFAGNMRAIDVNTGGGLTYTVLPDRGMDISLASYKGSNLVFITNNGEAHPSFYESEGVGWLRTFTGGLLTTCGLTHFGPPVDDHGEQLGLHGRYSTIPARQVADNSGWEGENYHIRLKGVIEEGHLFGNKIRNERHIESVIGSNIIRIIDIITNVGYQPDPFTILYHINIGYPMLDEHSVLTIDAKKTTARDQKFKNEISSYHTFIEPQVGYEERVFTHEVNGDKEGNTIVSLTNKKLSKGTLYVKFNTHSLPYCTEWKMMGQGEYVLGIEPCNAPCKNRKTLREEGLLPVLQPQESKRIEVEIGITEG